MEVELEEVLLALVEAIASAMEEEEGGGGEANGGG